MMNIAVNSLGFPVRPGSAECSFFVRTQTCKFGATCQFNHPEPSGNASVAVNPLGGFTPSAPAESFNSKGYPLRPGVPICSFFQKNGECKFGQTCKWDHTEGLDGGMVAGAGMGYATSGITNSLGNPIRPGQPVCNFFSKTGTCSFGPTCKFDHPEEFTMLAAGGGAPAARAPPAPIRAASGYNSLGFPIREGSLPCTFYLKTGTCTYGETCKWDHPEGAGGSQPKGAGKGATPTSNPFFRPTPY